MRKVILLSLLLALAPCHAANAWMDPNSPLCKAVGFSYCMASNLREQPTTAQRQLQFYYNNPLGRGRVPLAARPNYDNSPRNPANSPVLNPQNRIFDGEGNLLGWTSPGGEYYFDSWSRYRGFAPPK